eukprot:15367203-Ditylum_brightwellii.AAC.1
MCVANLWKHTTTTTRMVQKELDDVHEDKTSQIEEYSMQDDEMAMGWQQVQDKKKGTTKHRTKDKSNQKNSGEKRKLVKVAVDTMTDDDKKEECMTKGTIQEQM